MHIDESQTAPGGSLIRLKGIVEVFLQPGGKGKPILISRQNNTIATYVKELTRDTLAADQSGKYMGSGGYISSNIEVSDDTSSQHTKDGMVVAPTTGLANGWLMISGLHGSDPSGNYYRQWQGSFTATGVITMTQAFLGTTWSAGSDDFTNPWASVTFGASVPMIATDILLVNWKIQVA